MSNWALLQEQLTGLPVAKRAKYGIHFQKGDQIEAHLVGKPAHYLDGGLWKPIDTALLATADGWFSSPHSDVIIHPDGRVRVKGSNYQQFTKLPSAKAGKLAGDKIIREFPGGEQHLIMKEDGFREEIHVFKPTFPLEKFIAKKTTGNLPSKYKAHPITAEDAEGNTYTFTGDVAAFGAWLDKAVYPVVIDPDISITTGAGADTYLQLNSHVNNGAATVHLLNARWSILFRFDLSSIGSGSICSAATLKLLYTFGLGTGYTDLFIYKISDANGDWIEGTKSGTTAGAGEPSFYGKEEDGSGGVTTPWAGSTGLGTAGTDYIDTVLSTINFGNVSNNTPIELPFNESGVAVIQGWFGAATNNGLKMIQNSGSYSRYASGENATEAYRPILSVTYAAGGVPKHFMHYQRMRSL